MLLRIMIDTIFDYWYINGASIAISKGLKTQILWSTASDPRRAAATSCGSFLQHGLTICRCLTGCSAQEDIGQLVSASKVDWAISYDACLHHDGRSTAQACASS